MHRDFKGIWIPKEIWLNRDLTVMEKLFLVEIDSLDQVDGCFASNAHFSELFDISKGRCTQIIKSLEEKGVIKIEIIRDGKQISKRVVRVVNKLNTLFRKLNHPIKNSKYPYLENDEGNNTNTNNTKEREERALEFLKTNYQSRYETFLVQNKSQIKDFEKFAEDFNDTCDQEELKFSDRVLFGRLNKYARNWIGNQDKYLEKEEPQRNYMKKIL